MRWRSVQIGNGIPKVFYGFDHISTHNQKVFGGLVKLQDLQRFFPNERKNPNILYMVSSALPYFPVKMAQRAKNIGAKLVINQNGVAYPGWHGDGWEKTNLPMRQLIELADYIVYQSKFCKESADKYLGKCRHNNFQILYNPVDTQEFSPVPKKNEQEGRNRILVAGSHWSAYRIFVAIETLSRVHEQIENVSLLIAGRFCWRQQEFEAVREVKQYAKKLKVEDRIEISGSYTQQDAPELMRSCSVLLHTKYNDPCPRLVVEAMACGLPVVYSATGGVPELVGYGAGVGVPGPLDWEKDHPPGAVQLAAGIEKVLSDIEKYSSAARERAADKFDVTPWLDRHVEIFQSVL